MFAHTIATSVASTSSSAPVRCSPMLRMRSAIDGPRRRGRAGRSGSDERSVMVSWVMAYLRGAGMGGDGLAPVWCVTQGRGADRRNGRVVGSAHVRAPLLVAHRIGGGF